MVTFTDDHSRYTCNTTVYVHNQSPTNCLKDKTPYECLFGKKPDLSHLHVLGCKCYVNIPNSNRQKLDQKPYEAIFIGYHDERRIQGTRCMT